MPPSGPTQVPVTVIVTVDAVVEPEPATEIVATFAPTTEGEKTTAKVHAPPALSVTPVVHTPPTEKSAALIPETAKAMLAAAALPLFISVKFTEVVEAAKTTEPKS